MTESTQKRTEEVLGALGALQEGHFRLTSGRHSDKYMQCARLFEHPKESAELCALLACEFRELGVELVAGPALGGIIMAYEIARALGARNIFAERENGVMTLRRGFHVAPGTRVLVIEDVVTTGGSVKEVALLLRGLGANVIGAGAVVDRSAGKVELDTPFKALLTLDATSWMPDNCPLCGKGVPIVKPGSRKVK